MKLFYREYGSGIPLIILHGLYGSSDNWITIARSLSDSFRVILPDQRNHGNSPHDIVHSYDAMSSDLNELIEEIGLKHFYLLGHSMGGKTAMYYTSKWPDKISGLMILDISPFSAADKNNPTAGFHKMVLKELNNLSVSSLKTREEAESLLSENIHSPKIRKFLLKNLSREKNQGFRWKLNPINISNNLDKILEGFERINLADNAISGFPVVFVRAGKSEYIPSSDFQDIELMFPASEIITVEDSSHWIHSEKPEIIIELIQKMSE